jgi:nicotinamidase/pyrazinamidase
MKVLIIVDIQNDFLPGGALAVHEGDQIIPIVNRLIPQFEFVIATQDWHPPDHGSFASNHPGKNPGELIDLHGLQQVLWPNHCIQNTKGADFSAELNSKNIRKVFQKGTDQHIDSYSGFYDNGKMKDTGLNAFLTAQGIRQVYVVGLATDYCVKFTAIDAAAAGYDTHVIRDASRAVNLHKNDEAKALNEMRKKGIKIIDSSSISR